MKVLQFCMSKGVGGLELYVLRTAKHLLDSGVEVIAVTRRGSMLSQRMKDEGIPTVDLEPAWRFYPWIRSKQLARLFTQHQVDIVHMHDGKDLSLVALAKRQCKKPVKLIYTRQMMLTREKKDFYHRFFYSYVDLFITITRQLLTQAQQYLPMPSRLMKHLYYGVEKPPELSDADKQSIRQQFGVPRDCLALALVGRVEQHKGQHLLIEAVGQLRQQGVKVHASIIGPSMGDEYFDRIQQQLKQARLEPYVTIFGSHPNPIEIMGAFDVLVLATDQETFGLVLIEAMRNKVAVLGSRAGGVPEIIDDGKTGLLFVSGDAEDLAGKIKAMAEDAPMRQSLAQAGFERAEAMFTKEQHYKSLMGEYNRITIET